MQDFQAREKADREDPSVGEVVYVKSSNQRGTVVEIDSPHGRTRYKVLCDDGDTTIRHRGEIIRVPQQP